MPLFGLSLNIIIALSRAFFRKLFCSILVSKFPKNFEFFFFMFQESPNAEFFSSSCKTPL